MQVCLGGASVSRLEHVSDAEVLYVCKDGREFGRVDLEDGARAVGVTRNYMVRRKHF